MKTHALKAEVRTERGKNATHRVRTAGFIPAVVYSHGKTESIKIPKKDFLRLFKGTISESVLIDINIAGAKEEEKTTVVVKDYQLDPLTDQVLHLDFYQITAGEKFQTMVSVHFSGTSRGERMGGILEVSERELEIECLPRDLPEKIEIDVTNLEIGDSIHVKDLKMGESIRFIADGDRVIVAVAAPKTVKEEAVDEAEVEAEEVEKEEKQKSEE
ncbi:MAG TPA: 50S ribosomal protein L25/general stress protein Ctc [Spirochaetes bacterium]|nr:50S ribosomal protein L25/general stress protein Ctc [Spirochaetota bacterium]